MRSRSPRPFTILDGMILVAAVACAFGLHRAVVDAVHSHAYNTFAMVSRLQDLSQRVLEVEFPLLVTLTPAVLVMRLRRPRPRWRRLLRQPGMVACCAAILPIAGALLGLRQFFRFLSDTTVIDRGDIISYRIGPPLGVLFGSVGAPVGFWVLGAWLILALSGRRRPEKSGIDRVGRLVGIGWISITVMTALSNLAALR